MNLSIASLFFTEKIPEGEGVRRKENRVGGGGGCMFSYLIARTSWAWRSPASRRLRAAASAAAAASRRGWTSPCRRNGGYAPSVTRGAEAAWGAAGAVRAARSLLGARCRGGASATGAHASGALCPGRRDCGTVGVDALRNTRSGYERDRGRRGARALPAAARRALREGGGGGASGAPRPAPLDPHPRLHPRPYCIGDPLSSPAPLLHIHTHKYKCFSAYYRIARAVLYIWK